MTRAEPVRAHFTETYKSRIALSSPRVPLVRSPPPPPFAHPLARSNYPSLRYLYDTYHAQGLELIAFPANQFGGQAPGTDEEERAWAHKKFGFAFPVFDHIAVLDKPTPMFEGPTVISPVYRFLKDALPGEIPWNYTKCVIWPRARTVCCSVWAACGC
jgi:hypothetical protein